MSNFRRWLVEPYEDNPLMPNVTQVLNKFTGVRNEMVLKGYISATDFTEDNARDLVSFIKGIYNDYDMIEETNETICNYFEDTFRVHIIYYSQLLANYKKEYDFAVGNKRVVTRNDSLAISGQRDIENTDTNKHTDYELPNKVTDNNYESTPSSIGKDEGSNKSSNAYNNESSHSSSVVTEYQNEFLDLKKKYLSQIRDVLMEFARKFELCFQLVYDWRK